MNLKALIFDIIGTVFDAYDGLAQGVGPRNTKYGLNIQGAAPAALPDGNIRECGAAR